MKDRIYIFTEDRIFIANTYPRNLNTDINSLNNLFTDHGRCGFCTNSLWCFTKDGIISTCAGDCNEDRLLEFRKMYIDEEGVMINKILL